MASKNGSHSASVTTPEFLSEQCDALIAVTEQIGPAMTHLGSLRVAMRELEQQGMYPSVPSESWEAKSKSGEKDYLYMLFKTRSDGQGHAGPDGARRIAIGRDAEKIAEARAMAARRLRYEQLYALAARLDGWLRDLQHTIAGLDNWAKSWPRDKEVLGMFELALRGDGVPTETEEVPSGG